MSTRNGITVVTVTSNREEGWIKIAPGVNILAKARDWVFYPTSSPKDIRNCVGDIAEILIYFLRISGISSVGVSQREIYIEVNTTHRGADNWRELTRKINLRITRILNPKRIKYQ